MNEATPTLMMLVALLLSVGNLLVAFGRNRVKQAEIDVQALQTMIRLAEKTPDLEKQLRDTIDQLHAARTEAHQNKDKIDELNRLLAVQTVEIRRLKQENEQMAVQLAELRAVLEAALGSGA